ncbi:MAG: hypothetical protein ABIL58_27225 [Pseudomonadota bacterium]
MALNQFFQFQVDEQYENEKGVFTVLSMKNGQMEIQWEDGEKIQTDMDLQRSIQIRRQMEVHYAEVEVALNERKAAKASGVRNRRFDGMLATDFKDSAARTRWRGRDQLGGAVAQKLPRDELSIQSWAAAQRPEVHWQDATHRKRKGLGDPAVFFVRVDSQAMTYGLRVSRSAASGIAEHDWQALADWLRRPENEQQLQTTAAENDLTVDFTGQALSLRLQPTENGWQDTAAPSSRSATNPSALMDAATTEAPVVMEIAGSLPKEAVIERGGDIATDIAALFQRLMPLYLAAT